MKQIWKDTALVLSASTNYTIETGGKTVFAGRCDMQPDGTCEILTNKACQYWLKQNFPTATGVTVNPDACKRFNIIDADYNNLAVEDFIADWSYEDITLDHTVLSRPVNGVLDPRMKLLFSTYNETPYLLQMFMDLSITFDRTFPIYMSFRGGTEYIGFTANTQFTVSTTSTWLSVALDGNNIVLTASENEGVPRTGQFCIHWTDGEGVNRSRCYGVVEGGQDEPLDNQIWYFTDPADTASRFTFRISSDGINITGITASRYGDDGLWIASAETPIKYVYTANGPNGSHLHKIMLPQSVLVQGTNGSSTFFYGGGARNVLVDEIDFLSTSSLTVNGFNVTSSSYSVLEQPVLTIRMKEGVPTVIADFAFNDLTRIKGIDINLHSGITSIGSAAFAYPGEFNDGTLNLNWPVTVKGHAFKNANIKNLHISSAVTFDYSGWDIPDPNQSGLVQPYGSPFHNTPLETVVIDEGVTTIPRELFYDQSGATFTLPSTLTYIGRDAFLNSSVSGGLHFSSDVAVGYEAFAGATGITQIVCDGDLDCDRYAFRNCSGITGITVAGDAFMLGNGSSTDTPALKTLSVGGVLSADTYIFENCSSITTFSATKIYAARAAFSHSSIYGSVLIGGAVGIEAFGYCNGITSITIDSDCTSLGDYAFRGIQVTDITYNSTMDNWNSIPKGGFAWVLYSAIRYVHCTDGTIDIGSHA